MALGVFFEFVQLALQLEDGLFEIKLMFHRALILSSRAAGARANVASYIL
jgi:hypothetical protein